MRRPIAAVTAAAVATLLASTSLGAGAAELPPLRVGENTRLAPDARAGRLTDIPGIAVDPADPNHIVAVSEDFLSGHCEHHVTFDGGRSWQTGRLRAPAGFPSPPCPVFDSGGYAHTDGSVAFGSGQSVYTVFSSIRGTEGDHALVAKSTDGGRTFGVAAVAIPGGTFQEPVMSRPKLTVERRPAGDRVIVEAWAAIAKNGAGPGKLYRAAVAVSNDGAATWGSPVDASPLGQTVREISAPAVGPDGTIHLTWKNQDDNSLWAARSTNGGTSWTSAQVAPPTAIHPRIAVDQNTGRVYLAYQTAFGPEVLVRYSTDRGATWSAPVNVSDEKTAQKRLPQLGVAPDGRVDVMWHDRRHAYPGATMEDYYYAFSTDGGLTFSPNRRVTDRTINTDVGTNRRVTGGFYAPALASFSPDALLAAWGDSREGSFDTDNTDIYFARIDLGAIGSPRVDQLPPGPGAAAGSVSMSRLGYPAGRETLGTAAATRVVVVNEDDLPGALSGAVLARAAFGPVLASGASGLPAEVKQEVTRLQAVGAVLVGNEAALGAKVVDDLVAAGVPRDKVTRVAGTSAADTARLIASSLDTRSDVDKLPLLGKPAFAATVMVNPASPAAAWASAMAAALRLPVLFVDRDAVPQATKDALSSLAIQSTLVVGSPEAISDGVAAGLPGAKRLADSEAVVAESKARGLPDNVVYLADDARPMETAFLGAAVARAGGLMLSNPGADAAVAAASLGRLGIASNVDRLVVVTPASAIPQVAPGGLASAAPAAPGPTLPATGEDPTRLLAGLVLLAFALLVRRLRTVT